MKLLKKLHKAGRQFFDKDKEDGRPSLTRSNSFIGQSFNQSKPSFGAVLKLHKCIECDKTFEDKKRYWAHVET